MTHGTWTRIGAAVAIAVGMLTLASGEAMAFGHGGSSGSWGGSSSSGSWGGSSGSWGGWRARHSWKHHYAGYGSSSSGGWGGYYGGSSSSGGWGGHYSGGSSSSGGWGPIYEPGFDAGMPVGPQQPLPPAAPPAGAPADGAPAPVPPPAAGDGMASLNSAVFTVAVPADARVYVNDLQTRSTGAVRRYVSRGLEPGRTYTFAVRAEYVRDGQPVTETKTIRLSGGGNAALAFGAPAAGPQVAEKPAETKLTVRVPSDARVFLSDRPTRQTGEVRQFTTTRLAPGSEWENYIVRVTVERGGKLVSQERSIRLVGGEPQELEFTFDAQPADRLAAQVR